MLRLRHTSNLDPGAGPCRAARTTELIQHDEPRPDPGFDNGAIAPFGYGSANWPAREPVVIPACVRLKLTGKKGVPRPIVVLPVSRRSTWKGFSAVLARSHPADGLDVEINHPRAKRGQQSVATPADDRHVCRMKLSFDHAGAMDTCPVSR